MSTGNVAASEGNIERASPELYKKLNIKLIKQLYGAGDTQYARQTILLTDEPRVKCAKLE